MMDLYIRVDISSRSREYSGDAYGIEHLVGDYWSYEDLDDAARVVTFTEADEKRKLLDVDVVQHAQEWMTRYMARNHEAS
jgi:NADPH-dependent ferric siderophore reductase